MEGLIIVDSLEPTLLKNPLDLEFSMWFLTQPGISPHGIKEALRIIAAHVSEQISHVQLDFSVISIVYPVLELFQSKVKFTTAFFHKVLGRLDRTKYLIFEMAMLDTEALDSELEPSLQNISLIILEFPDGAGNLLFCNSSPVVTYCFKQFENELCIILYIQHFHSGHK